jgi:hypothetical protein
MRDRSLESLAIRMATVISRRSSLLAFGGAALAASAAPAPTLAGKANKKANNKANKKCKRQIGQCENTVPPACDDPELRVTREECLALILPCCQHFEGCQAGEVFDCLKAAAEAMAPAPP